MADLSSLTSGGYCHAPETVEDWQDCDFDGCEETPAYEFYPTEWFKPTDEDTDEDTHWYYICRSHLESIVGQIED